MRYRIFSFILISLLFAPLAPALAQSWDSIGNVDPFSVTVRPQYLAPGGQATLSFLSSTIDLTGAIIDVSVGGKPVYHGGVHPVPVTLGKTGSVTSVVVKVTGGGSTYSQTVALQPEEVSLIAEPLSSAPALYPGKPLVPLNGSARVVAIANFKDATGKYLSPSSLAYSWTVDGTQIANSSGIGKQTIVVASPLQYRTRTVSVTVHSISGSLIGGADLPLQPAQPTVRIYENDPLLGIRFDHAISDTYAINGPESSLYASPFSLPNTVGAPVLRWFLNGTFAQTGPLITLRPTGDGTGDASLSFTASFGNSISVNSGLSVSFGTKSSSNLFGL